MCLARSGWYRIVTHLAGLDPRYVRSLTGYWRVGYPHCHSPGVGIVSRSTVVIAAMLALVLSGASGCSSPQAQLQSASDPARVPVPTQSPWASPVACMDAALRGVLVADTRWGVAVARDQDGQVVEVVWPHGYFAGHDDGVSLYDEAGRLVGRAGDRVSLGGGYVVDGHVVELTWLACPGLAPLQSQPP
jgi:hypothetical protein